MNKLTKKIKEKERKYLRRKNRTNTICKKQLKSRIIVNRSNKYIYVQVVDVHGKVIDFANDLKLKEGTKLERAKQVGLDLAKKLQSKKLKDLVFDRNGFLYHGRIKSLVDGIREGGLEI